MMSRCYSSITLNHKITMLVVVLLLNCLANNAQIVNGKIYGKVFDQQSLLPLPGVNIVFKYNGLTGGTITDTSGNFVMQDVPVGRLQLEFSSIGYEVIYVDNVNLTSGKDVCLEIGMLEKIELLDEVVIKAFTKNKAKNEFAPVSSRSFTIDETNRFAGSWGDPARMVSNYAGVVTAGDQRNDIIIRGNSPTGLLWQLEGIPIPNPNHFGTFGTTGGPISILNNNQLSNSDFFTSAFPAEYGNALSGAFDLMMRKGNTQNHEFLMQMGFNGFELGAEGPLIKKIQGSYLVNYRYTMMDLMTALGLFDVGGIPKYSDLSFKLFLPTKKMGTFSVFGLGGNSEIKLKEDKGSGWTSDMLPGTSVYYGSSMRTIGIANKYFLSENSRIESTVSYNLTKSFNVVDSIQSDSLKYFNYYNDEYQENKLLLSVKFKKKFNTKNIFHAGISIEKYFFNFYDETFNHTINDYINQTDIENNATLYQGYVQYKNRLTNNFSLNLGLHGLLLDLNNKTMIEPRAGLSYKISDRHSISAGYGLHGQIQPRLVYFVQTLIDTINSIYESSNRNLDFTKSHHFTIGYDFTISQDFRIKLESYYQHLYDVPIEKTPSYYSILNYGAGFYNELVDSMENNGLGKNYGIEYTLEKFLSNNYYFLLTASLYESKYRANDNIWRNTVFNGNYTINFLIGYELPVRNNAFSVNLKTVLAGGKRYIPIDIENSKTKGETVYKYENAYQNKFDDYFRIDLRISFRQNLARISQEWSFDVQNLTDHKNILTQRYDADKESVVNILQMGFFPIGSWKLFF